MIEIIKILVKSAIEFFKVPAVVKEYRPKTLGTPIRRK